MRVIEVADAPPIATGGGRLVTGRFRHVADEILALHVEGLGEPIRCTPRHPFWSVDREAFVKASSLQPGERLLTNTGAPARVVSLSIARSSTPVYNIEVHGEHVFRVTQLGLLVHNASWAQKAKKLHGSADYVSPSSNNIVRRKTTKGLAGDHVFPQQAMHDAIKAAKKKGRTVTSAQITQIEDIVNGASNLRLMPTRLNSSKGDLSIQGWMNTPLGSRVNRQYRLDAARIQRDVAQQVDAILGGGVVNDAFFNAKII